MAEFEFTGRVAVVTGGASGIGLATAEALAGRGMKLVLADVEEPVLDGAVDRLRSAGAEAVGVACDVGDLQQVEALAETTWDTYGGCHVLFNNAGVAVFGPIQEMTHQDWEWCLRVDLWGPIHGVEAFVPRMIEGAEGGHVVSTASFAGLVPNRDLGVYCVAKYGVVALSEVLRNDLKPHGIGVSVLCPMRVETNIDASHRNRPEHLGGAGNSGAIPAPTDDELVGRLIGAGAVAEMVVQAIAGNELYVIPHPESRQFIRNRFERIDRAFDSLPGVEA
jgi:NAD(P)-dependent dehydrogenase (short-subunit alcohol dehydrogenase family)